jgi:hypothetical protein
MCTMGGMAQSVWRLAAGWTVRGSNPDGGRDFQHLSRPATGPTHPGVQWEPAVCTRGKRPVRDLDPPPNLVSLGLHGRF